MVARHRTDLPLKGCGPNRASVCPWPDTFTNNFHPHARHDAANVLEAAGCKIMLPQRIACGTSRTRTSVQNLRESSQAVTALLMSLDDASKRRQDALAPGAAAPRRKIYYGALVPILLEQEAQLREEASAQYQQVDFVIQPK